MTQICWNLLDLPDDAIFFIFRYLSLADLCKLATVCRRLYTLINLDHVWYRSALRFTNISLKRSHISLKERCRIARNWELKNYKQRSLVRYRVSQLPWIYRDDDQLWMTQGSFVNGYRVRSDGVINKLPACVLKGHGEDACRFRKRENIVVSGGSDGSIYAWDIESKRKRFVGKSAHAKATCAVDFSPPSAGHLIVSGSKDQTVKLWRMKTDHYDDFDLELVHQSNCCPLRVLDHRDRVWCVGFSKDYSRFATGTAGITAEGPLFVWDASSCQTIASFGAVYQHGAGILDLDFETRDLLLTAGYDTFIRMWDLRSNKCVLTFEEPFDSAIYCFVSVGMYGIVAGTYRYGMVRLWDKRHVKPVQEYYVGDTDSPVYSLAGDCKYLYVALDRNIMMLDYTV